MARTGQAGSMGTSVFLCLLIILLTTGSPAACAGDNSSATHSTASTAEKPVLLDDVADAEAFISGAEVAVIGFFQDFIPQSDRRLVPCDPGCQEHEAAGSNVSGIQCLKHDRAAFEQWIKTYVCHEGLSWPFA